MEKIIREFPVTVYGNLIKYSDTISKARCRIFYKYENRNGTYISDTFAEKLLATIPYTPVKGIYDDFNEDYTDHGQKRDEGRIYGIVPENPNLEWETHLDEDGIERTYACVDVLIFTALYEEAGEIIGKAQSMEIYEPSIKGAWKTINGKRMYEYTEGSFLGLQVLGEEVEPCFEGAAFFSLYNSMKKMLEEIEEYKLKMSEFNKGGQLKMPGINFKLSDNQKHDALWNLLNTEYNEEGGWAVSYSICDIYDNYAIAYNYAENSYERVYYVKDDETDTVSITEKVKVFIVDVTEEEFNTLNTIKMLNNGTYVNAEAVYTEKEELEAKNGEFELTINNLNEEISVLTEEKTNFEQKIEELNNNISTLNSENEVFTNQVTEANEKIQSLTEEVNTLNSYKEGIEKKEKEAIINSYAELLDGTILANYEEKISEYTVMDLDKELAYELKKTHMSVFSKDTGAGYIPKDNERTGLEAILSKYKK